MSEDYIKIILFCSMFGGGLVWQALKRQKRVREIEDTPKSKIASAPQGLVELQGFAWPADKGHIASSGHELVYYKFSLEKEETRGAGKNKKKVWVSVFNHAFIKPFYVLDPTGLAIVDPTTGELELDSTNIKLWTSLKQHEHNYYLDNIIPLTVPNFPPKGRFFGLFSNRYRIVETEIRSGCPIYVTGDFKTHNSEIRKVTSQGLTHFANRIIDSNNRAFKNLKAILDKDGDGKISYKEAKDGYSLAAQLSKKRTATENLTENEFEVFGVMACSQNRKLFLADAHEGHVVDKLKRGHITRLFGGSALLAVAVVMTVRLFVSDAAIENAMKMESKVEAQVQAQVNLENAQREKNKLITEFHKACVGGHGASCVELLSRRDDLQLDAKYVEYYSNAACKNGVQKHCVVNVERLPASATNTKAP